MLRFPLLTFFLLVFALPACAQEEVHRERLVVESGDELHVFQVEIADAPHEQAQGLMHRTEMAEDHGMFFIFGDYAPRRFWMKNTLIPLDIIFVHQDGVIHHIHRQAQPHDTSGAPSNGPAKAVLEINGGLSDQLGIKEGDRVLHAIFTR